MFTVTRITEVSALCCPPPPGRFRHRFDGDLDSTSLSASRLTSSQKRRQDSRCPPPQEAHVQNDGEHPQCRPGINTSHSSSAQREEPTNLLTAVQPTTTTASMNALISAKRTTSSGASHVMITPANRHRPGRYVLLYSNSIGLTIHPPPIKRPTHLGINTLPTIRQIRMQDLHIPPSFNSSQQSFYKMTA